jgi:LuxR family maltose regulon positive regulatory protein
MRRAKLLPPRLGTGLVPRPRLIHQLNESLDQPLILVIGPAGFGKTTLLGEWLASAAVDSAWLTLDAADSDLHRFISQFVMAIQTVHQDVGESTLAALKLSHYGPEALGATLGDELLDLPSDLVLVLDDYHEVPNVAIHEFLAALLQYPPQHLHLIVSSRTDPPLALARQRGRGYVSEIRAADLRFTVEETRLLLTKVSESQIDDRVVLMLQERTEGWVAGLRLASIAMHGRSDHVTLTEAFAAIGDRHVMDFLIEEVLARQPDPIQNFLLHTSIVDRICGDLGDAMLGYAIPGSAAGKLEWLTRSDLYVEQFGEEPVWYRYHPLFHELLRHRLAILVGQEEVAALHRRASAWFAGQQMIDDAVAHSIAAGEADLAADLVEQHVERALATEEWPALEAWLRMLPSELIQARPALLFARARIARLRSGVSEGLRPLLRDIEGLIAGDDGAEAENFRADLALFDVSSQLFDTHVDEYLDAAHRALDLLGPEKRFARGRALTWLGLALQAKGRPDEAIRRLGLELGAEAGHFDTCTEFALFGIAVVHLREGDLDQAAMTAQYMLRLATEHGLEMASSWAHQILGTVAYEYNDLETAISHFSAVAAGRRYAAEINLLESTIGLALSYQALGRVRESEETIARLLEQLLESKNLEHLPLLHSLQARLALLRGDRAEAIRWLGTSGVSIDAGSVGAIEVSLITHVKVLLAEDTPEGLEEAARHLDELSERADAIRDRRRKVELNALRALVFQAQGRPDLARAALEETLTLASPKGLVRTFIDLGPRLAPLLRTIARNEELAAYSAQILTAFSTAETVRVLPMPRSRFQVFEVLTEREAQILDCLSRQLSNQEIADELFISPLTVKRHASNIYDKLGVANRRQALLKAEEFGLLPAT